MAIRKILGSKTRQQENGEYQITRSFMIFTPHQMLFGVIKSRRMRWAGNVARMRTGEVHTGFWWGNLMEIDHLKDLRRRLENNIKINLQDVGWGGMDWIALAEDGDRRRPSGSKQCRKSRD